jgi:hypothetical protein
VERGIWNSSVHDLVLDRTHVRVYRQVHDRIRDRVEMRTFDEIDR